MAENPEEVEQAKKQDYLREHILEKDYDVSEFVSYLDGLKENGSDVNSWKLEELPEVVANFVKMIEEKNKHQEKIEDFPFVEVQPPQPEPVQSKPLEPDSVQSKPPELVPAESAPAESVPAESKLIQYKPEEPSPLEPVPAESEPAEVQLYVEPEKKEEAEKTEFEEIKGEDSPSTYPGVPPNLVLKEVEMDANGRYGMFINFPHVVKTKYLNVSELTKTKIKIQIIDTSTKAGGILSSDVVNFVIETKPFGWVISRRYKELLWLHDMLQRHYPTAIVPPLDPRFEKDHANESYVSGARREIEKFFTELQRDPYLRSADITYYFLSLVERVQFDKKYKEIKKWPAPKSIADMKHFNGESNIDIEVLEKAHPFSRFAPEAASLYTRFQKAAMDTEQIMNLLSDSFFRNADLFREFSALGHSINSAEISDTMNQLKSICLEMGELHHRQSKLIQENFGKFFKYYQLEIEKMINLSEKVAILRSSYLEKEKELYDKKMNLYKNKSPLEWDLLPHIAKKLDLKKLQLPKSCAFPLMLYKPTAALGVKRQDVGYYSNRLVDELSRANLKNYRTMRKHFLSTAGEYSELFLEISKKWKALQEHLNVKISKQSLEEKNNILENLSKEIKSK